MRVLAINGSPHKNGTTFAAVKVITDSLESQGIETELYHIGSEAIACCMGCGHCKKHGKCIHDDGVNEVAEKLKTMDGLILSSPTYYGGIAGGAKCFYDRLFYVGANMQCKVGAVAAVARRSGSEDVYHQLCSYLTLSGAVIAPTTYWNVAFGNNGEEMMQDEEGICIMQKVGESMSWLLKMLDQTKDTVPAPRMTKDKKTNFIR